jgi:2-oxoglutarate ferredoxin oxidoreductase subunit alpha
MSEAISYIAGAQCPAVFVNIMRGGPGLGGFCPPRGTTFRPPKAGDMGTAACW